MININQITHNSNFLGCYPLNEDELKVSITTGKDIEKVFIYERGYKENMLLPGGIIIQIEDEER